MKIRGPFYHGTTARAARSIRGKAYLLPPNTGILKGLVYATKDPIAAQDYAEMKARDVGGTPVVIEFTTSVPVSFVRAQGLYLIWKLLPGESLPVTISRIKKRTG